ncbi:glycosyl transferase family protein [Sphingomonas lycopersici]|uniref:Glycosyl transferase family protein n=1 Tax=Sphingomonas lycopersici TaxID=2951807 RepID=A0AA41Z8S7_9SPHN|nr:glycosyl transferase family protein [Sphingomonas lycopersici]MCW6534998.1 glycosyl transferase family protein [Sphingomonas lycopersici]
MGRILLEWLGAATREATLFAAIGFLIGGIDDLLVDVIWLTRRLRQRGDGVTLADLSPPARPRRFAILVPAWDESAVIGAMLRTTLARLDHPDFIIIVGCYPNDRATIAVVADIAAHDRRVRLTIGRRHGPTTKADCLNTLWRAVAAADARDRRRSDAIVLHDAEDVVHPAELRIFDALLDRHAVVQIPVLPLARRDSRLVSGHYLDEFAEAHSKQLPVRTLLRAAVPLAGVGCAIRVEALARVAADHHAPFDPTSLTEDYELGLRLASVGAAAHFARVRETRGGTLIAVREYFPATIAEAVRQKARWMTGIALAGWDRLGWGRLRDIGDHWMRLHDRRAPLAVITLATGYVAIVGWAGSAAGHLILGSAVTPPGPTTALLLLANAALLAWRAAVRAGFTAAAYGWREALWSPPRMIVGNIIALLAARRAAARYAAILAGRTPQWDKTAHAFPTDIG